MGEAHPSVEQTPSFVFVAATGALAQAPAASGTSPAAAPKPGSSVDVRYERLPFHVDAQRVSRRPGGSVEHLARRHAVVVGIEEDRSSCLKENRLPPVTLKADEQLGVTVRSGSPNVSEPEELPVLKITRSPRRRKDAGIVESPASTATHRSATPSERMWKSWIASSASAAPAWPVGTCSRPSSRRCQTLTSA